jgi:rod shape-determining protein MreC
MTALLVTKTARRRGIAFTILLSATLVMMAFSSSPPVRELQKGVAFAFSPIQRGLDGFAGGISSVFAAIAEIDRLRSDNATLREENERLTAGASRLEEVRRENGILTGLLQLQAGFDHTTVATTVIGRESSEFRRVVTVDKGTRDGLSEGDVVVAAGGALAGRITVAGPTESTVTLLTDTESTVIGQLISNAATGEVVGQLGGVLIMGKIDSSEEIQPGDEVVTAGIELAGGIRSPYPKGLLIGQVLDVVADANDVVQTAFLQPAAQLDKLEYLLVITDYEGGLPPPDEQPIDCTPTGEGVEGEPVTLPEGERPCIGPTPAPSGSAAPGGSAGPTVGP